MSCDGITIPEFIPEQQAECRKCNQISDKKVFCGHFGCWIDGRAEIIQPNEKLLMSNKPPTLADMILHFTKAIAKWAKSGFKTVSKEIYFKRRLACAQCQPTRRCPHCGCNLWAKAVLATENCPKGKW